MTDRIDKVSNLAGAPITNTPLSASDTSIQIADQAGDIDRFEDPGSQGYDAYIFFRTTHPNIVDAVRAGVAERVRVTAKGSDNLTVTRDLDGSGALTIAPNSGQEYWIVAGTGATIQEQIDDRIFDLVGGELVRDINVEMADLRCDDAKFAGLPHFDVTHSDYGATGDGVTDDGPAVDLALDAAVAAGGGVVYFPKGTYLLTTWTATGYSPGGSATLVLKGDGAQSIVKGDGSDIFMDVDDEMEVVDLNFQSFSDVFSLDGISTTRDYFRVRRCLASSCEQFVDWGTPLANGKLTEIDISDNTLVNLTGRNAIGINDDAVGSGWEACRIRNNYIDGGGSSTLQTGIKLGFAVTSSVDTDQGKWKKCQVIGNTVRRINGGASWHGRGIVVYGTMCTIHGNIIDTISGTAGSSFQNCGIQAGIRYGSIQGNTIRGITGTTLRNNGILLYGSARSVSTPSNPYCHGVDVSGNQITYDTATTDPVGIGFQFGGSEIQVHDNQIIDAEFGIYQPQGTHPLERVRIHNNDVDVVSGGSDMIFNGGGNDWRIAGNVLSGGAEGIRIAFAQGCDRMVLSENQIDATIDGIVFANAAGQITRLTIMGNTCDNATDSLQFNNSTATPDEVLVALNDFDGNINVSGNTPTNYRVLSTATQDSRAQLRHEQDLRVGDGNWDGDHLIVGTRRFWIDTAGRERVKTSAPASSLDGNPWPFVSSDWDGAHVKFGNWSIWADTAGNARVKSSDPASSTDGTIFNDGPATIPVYLENSIVSSIQVSGGGSWVSNTVTVSGALPGDLSVMSHENAHPEVVMHSNVTATDTITCYFVRTGLSGNTFNLPSGTQRAGVLRTG